MSVRRITADLVESMKPGDQIFDSVVKGFAVRHRGGGAHYFLKTRVRGRQRTITIGRHGRGYYGPESARREAVRLLGLIRDGRDPGAEREAERNAPTLAEFADRYMTEYAVQQKRPRTVEEDRRLLAQRILPALGRMKMREIERADVARWHAKMSDTPVAANRALALLSSVLGWAERVGERKDGTNPCRYVAKFPERARERFLSAEELGRLGDVLATAEATGLGDWRPVACIRLLILTGARLGEILGLRWEMVSIEAGTARLPESKTGPKTIFLPAPALELLAGLPRFAANPYVIPGDRPGAPFVGIEKAWQRIRAAAGLDDVHLHDLRHSFASTAVAAGDSLAIVGKLLGHRKTSTTERYAHLAPDPIRAAADRTGERIQAMLEGETAPVLPLPKRSA